MHHAASDGQLGQQRVCHRQIPQHATNLHDATHSKSFARQPGVLRMHVPRPLHGTPDRTAPGHGSSGTRGRAGDGEGAGEGEYDGDSAEEGTGLAVAAAAEGLGLGREDASSQ